MVVGVEGAGVATEVVGRTRQAVLSNALSSNALLSHALSSNCSVAPARRFDPCRVIPANPQGKGAA